MNQTLRKGRRYDLRITQNDAVKLRATLQDDGGDAIDLTNGTVKLYAKIHPSDSSALIDITGSVVSAALGIVDFSFTTTHTANVRKLFAEVELQDVEATGINETLVKFDLAVTQDVG